ncbi:2920_t:CDS:2 [Diversispora eburnea]|uniref:2920_t:CDS:1 n=1 Tax=Diversispora eburnea TaxID=1213867 RepID=A0A9N9GBV8_9GLOM|nr:2920_t:CDS:2 [Diversispora eburnea]
MGFWEGVWEVEKFIFKAAGAAAVGTAIVATGGAALPLATLGATVVAEGYCIKKVGETSGNEVAKEICEVIGGSLMGGGGDTIIGGHVSKATKQPYGRLFYPATNDGQPINVATYIDYTVCLSRRNFK